MGGRGGPIRTFRAARSLMWMLPKSTRLICGNGSSSSATAFVPPPPPLSAPPAPPPAAASASIPSPSSAPLFPCISSFACTLASRDKGRQDGQGNKYSCRARR